MSPPRQKPGRSKQDYSTPRAFLTAVKRRLHIEAFTFDFAADRRNRKSPDFWSAKDNSLRKSPFEWAQAAGAGWGWLNPPFGDIEPWAKACWAAELHGASIAFLVPMGAPNWFVEHVHHRALVLALNGRLAFIEGQPKELYPKDCMLCLFSPLVAPGFDVWSWKA